MYVYIYIYTYIHIYMYIYMYVCMYVYRLQEGGGGRCTGACYWCMRP